jgi:hypothetical protein
MATEEPKKKKNKLEHEQNEGAGNNCEWKPEDIYLMDFLISSRPSQNRFKTEKEG